MPIFALWGASPSITLQKPSWVSRPTRIFPNVSNFFNYLTAIFLLSPRTDIGCENYNKTPLKTVQTSTDWRGGMKEFA